MAHHKTYVGFRIGEAEYLLYFSYEYPSKAGKFFNIIFEPELEWVGKL